MKLTKPGIEFIKTMEGLNLEAYRDEGGIATIGYGHTLNVRMGDLISSSQAEFLLVQDLISVEKTVNQLVKVKLTDGEYTALCDFVFNEGVTAFFFSTLITKLNKGDKLGAAKEFEKWIFYHEGGLAKESMGLKIRRAKEEDLFLGGFEIGNG